MNILVTGAAGFIGSHLCERLLEDGRHDVTGIDGFIQPELKPVKLRNLQHLSSHPRFHFYELNLLEAEWSRILPGIDVIYHLAAMPGVRSSWGTDFHAYVTNNILVTQRLLEACKEVSLKQFVYVSTSSIYGEMKGKVRENKVPSPLSPYGVSKLTGEHLCRLYYRNWKIPLVILRYFTVYGPRQRGDMAFHRFMRALLLGEPVPVNGDGTQTRDFTYISDCVEATASLLGQNHVIGETFNIGGKERASVLDVISLLEEITGIKAVLHYNGKPLGEPKHTWADISKAEKLLSYGPKVGLRTGLADEWTDLQDLYHQLGGSL